MTLEIVPITRDEAFAFVREHHRHHLPPTSHRFSIAAALGEQIVGVAVVGRPVARGFDDGWTAEVTRVATDGTRNACSFLYGAAWRAARALGFRRLITYTLEAESGTSLRAAGWRVLHEVKGRSWDTPTRPRVDKHPTQNKICWEASA